MLHPHVEVMYAWDGRWPYSSSCERAIAVDHLVTASSHGTNDRSGRHSETPRTIVSRCGEDTTGARRAGCDGERVVPYAHDVLGTHTVHESSPVVQRDLRPAACTRVADKGRQREEPASSRSRCWRTRCTNSRSATAASNTVAPSSVSGSCGATGRSVQTHGNDCMTPSPSRTNTHGMSSRQNTRQTRPR
jgi:hypothetical protein